MERNTRTAEKTFWLPDYYGENWDALWDCLQGLFYGEDRRVVEIYGFMALDKELREYCAPMLQVFEDVHQNTPNVVFRIIS